MLATPTCTDEGRGVPRLLQVPLMMCLTEMNPPIIALFKALIASKSPKSGSEDVKQMHENVFRVQVEPVCDHTHTSLLQQTLACSILTALLTEFSSSSKTSSIGLSMEFHGSCKRLFQVCSPLVLCPSFARTARAPVMLTNGIFH